MAIHAMRPGMRRRGFRGLGTISAQVGNGMIYGSDAIGRRSGLPVRPIMVARPIGPAYPIRPTNGGIAPAWGVVYRPGAPYQSGGLNLAQLQQMAQSNPASLTPSQVQALQAAGTLPGTLPPTSAGLISTGSGAIDPATGLTYASELATAQATPATAATVASSVLGTDPVSGATTIFGIDWYYLAGAAAALYLFTQKRGR